MKHFEKRHFIIFAILIIVETLAHFAFTLPFGLIFKPLFLVYLGFEYYNISKIKRKKDVFFIVSLVFSMVGEFLFEYRGLQIVQVFILITYLVEHQLYISIFRLEDSKLTSFISKANYKITVPILLFFFLFYGFFMMPTVPESLFVLTIFYCVQLAILGATASLRQVNPASYKWVMMAVAFLVLSDAFTSINLFMASFFGDYVLIRMSYLVSKVMMAKGLLLTINPLEKEHT